LKGDEGMLKRLREKTHNYLQNISYKELLKNYIEPVFILDNQGFFLELNEGFTSLTGYRVEEFIGRSFMEIVYSDDKERALKDFEKSIDGQILKEKTYKIILKNGEIRSIRVNKNPIFSDKGKVIGIIGIGIDVTSIYHSQSQSQEQQQYTQIHSLIKNSHDVICIIDENKNLLYRSPSIEKVLGYKPTEIVGTILKIIHPDDEERLIKEIENTIRDSSLEPSMEFRLQHKNGAWRYFHAILSNQMENPNLRGIVINYNDITEMKKAKQEVHFMAYYDYLTELPNRRFLEEKLELEMKLSKATNTKIALMFIDLDRFKYINDTLGHVIGDSVLIEVAKTLKFSIGDNDVIRLGGDEFIVVLKNITSSNQVEEVAKKIIEKIDRPIIINDYELFVTVSIGISIYPDSSEDINTLMKNADLAKNLIKENGKNNYQIFTPSHNEKINKTFYYQNDLRKAVTNNELEIFYQPIMSASTAQMVGAEALIRWNHPVWGVVSPADFIPLAEESGLIVQIGEWTLRTVCQQIKEWESSWERPIKLSINLSVIQLLQKDFIKSVASIIEEYKINSSFLEFEITESLLMISEKEIEPTFIELKKLGVKVALDDFGTGFSSLGYLQKYKFDTLKLDRLFIQNIHKSAESEAIVQFIINLAKQFKFKVIAEGVEYQEQLQLLQELGCHEVQGYLYSKPKPVREFELLLPKKEQKSMDEHRKYFRVNLSNPIEAEMTIVRLKNKEIQVGNTRVLLKDIGPGGLSFVSDISLPANIDLALKFTVTILGTKVVLFGNLVWTKALDGQNHYGIKFIVNEDQRCELIKIFNTLQIELRKGNWGTDNLADVI
jgi:diguanylate cyclase (GGDEF)-like protein/PAS domain S-box-containing protein